MSASTDTAAEATSEVADLSPLEIVEKGYDTLLSLRIAAREAAQAVTTHEDAFRKELSALLVGKTVEVTGYTETEEFYGQSEVENAPSFKRLDKTRVIIKNVFITEDRFGQDRSPLVFAVYEEAHIKRQFAGGLSFRLRKLQQLRIVEPAPRD